ncbi:hypothetical protein DFJ73DRAFT_815112 [Zopfochytrium polystomum]|nr:hypothetical protein DFJ73DRAFT_815112 [Zopfochytrium polystomum]
MGDDSASAVLLQLTRTVDEFLEAVAANRAPITSLPAAAASAHADTPHAQTQRHNQHRRQQNREQRLSSSSLGKSHSEIISCLRTARADLVARRSALSDRDGLISVSSSPSPPPLLNVTHLVVTLLFCFKLPFLVPRCSRNTLSKNPLFRWKDIKDIQYVINERRSALALHRAVASARADLIDGLINSRLVQALDRGRRKDEPHKAREARQFALSVESAPFAPYEAEADDEWGMGDLVPRWARARTRSEKDLAPATDNGGSPMQADRANDAEAEVSSSAENLHDGIGGGRISVKEAVSGSFNGLRTQSADQQAGVNGLGTTSNPGTAVTVMMEGGEGLDLMTFGTAGGSGIETSLDARAMGEGERKSGNTPGQEEEEEDDDISREEQGASGLGADLDLFF